MNNDNDTNAPIEFIPTVTSASKEFADAVRHMDRHISASVFGVHQPQNSTPGCFNSAALAQIHQQIHRDIAALALAGWLRRVCVNTIQNVR